MAITSITIETRASERDRQEFLVEDVRHGLTGYPKELPARWLYDERGSQLFEEITRLPEYYLTRTEIQVLEVAAADIARRTRPTTIIDLGAGSSKKTRILIEAAWRAGTLVRFAPFDVSRAIVEEAAGQIATAYPSITVHAVIGDFTADLSGLPRLGQQLVTFLGSTIGNFTPEERKCFLHGVRGLLEPGDAFLLGVDLIKEEAELLAAYDDAAGVTSAFNRNVLTMLNRELNAGFDVDSFEHVAVYNAELARMELSLRSTRQQRVHIPGASLEIEFERGELLQTEISAKFTRPMIEEFFGEANMTITAWYTDSRGRFALALGTPTPVVGARGHVTAGDGDHLSTVRESHYTLRNAAEMSGREEDS